MHILLCSRLLLDLLLNDIALVLINGSLYLSRAVLTEIDDRLFLRLRIRRGAMLLALAGLLSLFGWVA